MRILLISTYELGHQPFNLASSAAHLLNAGFEVQCLDLSVSAGTEAAIGRADLIAFSTPMHTALRLARSAAQRARQLNPKGHICFFGLYASMHAELLLGSKGGFSYADSVIGGEFESTLVDLARRVAVQRREQPEKKSVNRGQKISFERQRFLLPHRSSLPALKHYAHLVVGDQVLKAGYVEASRGCAHRCLHCPITPVYDGRVRIVQKDIVLKDIEQLVGLGAEHITFGDPDFLNGVRHSLNVLRAMHEAFPRLTFDFTAKVEHILQYESLFPEFRSLGCLFVVSAVELLNDVILGYLDKGHTRQDVDQAIRITKSSGVAIRPSLMPFTPWTAAQDLLDIFDWVEANQLYDHIDPVQFTVRLLVPPNSSLLSQPHLQPFLDGFDSARWIYAWHTADQRLDELQVELSKLVEQCAEDKEGNFTAYVKLRQKVLDFLGLKGRERPKYERKRLVPRLTEDWFC